MNQLTFNDLQIKQESIDDICANRHGGNPNSVEAHNPKTAAKQRAEILDYIKIYENTGKTCWEIHRELGIGYTSCSARCSELKRMGLVYEDGRRETIQGSGSMASVLKVKK